MIAVTFSAGVAAAVVKSNESSDVAQCSFDSVLPIATPLAVDRTGFRLALPDGWVSIDPHSADVDIQISAIAGDDRRLNSFLLATSKTATAGAKVIAAKTADPKNENLLVETARGGLRLDSKVFPLALRAEVESAGFQIRSLSVCDFQHTSGPARLASYDLADRIQGGQIQGRVSFVETDHDLWVLATFGKNTEVLDRNLISILRSFSTP
jgi:hypothetical protein